MNTSIMVQSSKVLSDLYEAFDQLGLVHRYSDELGEFDVNLNARKQLDARHKIVPEDNWVMFYVDPNVLAEERAEDSWAEDAYAVADGYWRQ